jgi:hypothetical protein
LTVLTWRSDRSPSTGSRASGSSDSSANARSAAGGRGQKTASNPLKPVTVNRDLGTLKSVLAKAPRRVKRGGSMPGNYAHHAVILTTSWLRQDALAVEDSKRCKVAQCLVPRNDPAFPMIALLITLTRLRAEDF